jgi:hypothetical protein
VLADPRRARHWAPSSIRESLRLRYLDYQAPVELTNWLEITRSLGLSFFDVGCSASDHQLVGDAAYIHLEIEALHRRARKMPGQTAEGGSAARDQEFSDPSVRRPTASFTFATTPGPVSAAWT